MLRDFVKDGTLGSTDGVCSHMVHPLSESLRENTVRQIWHWVWSNFDHGPSLGTATGLGQVLSRFYFLSQDCISNVNSYSDSGI